MLQFLLNHISLVPLKAINQATNTKFPSETPLEIKENPYITREQPEFVLILPLQRLGSHVPDTYMAVLRNPRDQKSILKWNMMIGYIKEFNYKEKDPLE